MEGGDGVAIHFHLRNSGSGLHRKSPPEARIWNQPLGRLIQGFLLLLISETHAGPLRTWLDNFRPSSLFILDEAHHAAPSSGGPLSEGDVQAPGSPVRGTVRISTSKPALFWGSVANSYKRLQRKTLHLTGIASRGRRDEPLVQF